MAELTVEQLSFTVELTPSSQHLVDLYQKLAAQDAELKQLRKFKRDIDDYLTVEWVEPVDGDYRAALHRVIGNNIAMVLDPAISAYASAVEKLVKIAREHGGDHAVRYLERYAQEKSAFKNLRRAMTLNRNIRQDIVHGWTTEAFGDYEANSIVQRGLRFLEEALELAQAAGVPKALAFKLVSYVYGRPVGDLAQELGGVGVTVLALAAAARINTDHAELTEVHRVLSMPLEHFRKRNAQKSEAGLKDPSL